MSVPTIAAKIGTAVASLTLSVGVYLIAAISDPENAVDSSMVVPLKVRNRPDNLAVATIPAQVTLREHGSPESIKKLDPATINAFIDLGDAKSGTQMFRVYVENPTGVKLSTEDVSVRLEDMIRKDLKVSVETLGGRSLNSKLLYLGSQAQPETVTVEGPRSQVDQVTKVRALLDLSSVTPGRSYPVTLEPMRDDERPAPSTVHTEPRQVMVQPALSPAPDQRPLLVVPTFTGQPAPGFEVESVEVSPTQVMVRGPGSLLSNSTVRTSPISLSGLTSSTSFLTKLVLPPKAKSDKGSRVTVRVRIRAVVATPSTSGPPGP